MISPARSIRIKFKHFKSTALYLNVIYLYIRIINLIIYQMNVTGCHHFSRLLQKDIGFS